MEQSRNIDIAGKIRLSWLSSKTGNIYTFKFDVEPSAEILTDLCEKADLEFNLSLLPRFDFIDPKDLTVISSTISAVTSLEDITLEGYNTYLDNLSWADKATIQYYMNKVTAKLIELGEVLIEENTEESIYLAVANYLKSKTSEELSYMFNINI